MEWLGLADLFSKLAENDNKYFILFMILGAMVLLWMHGYIKEQRTEDREEKGKLWTHLDEAQKINQGQLKTLQDLSSDIREMREDFRGHQRDTREEFSRVWNRFDHMERSKE